MAAYLINTPVIPGIPVIPATPVIPGLTRDPQYFANTKGLAGRSPQ